MDEYTFLSSILLCNISMIILHHILEFDNEGEYRN